MTRLIKKVINDKHIFEQHSVKMKTKNENKKIIIKTKIIKMKVKINIK